MCLISTPDKANAPTPDLLQLHQARCICFDEASNDKKNPAKPDMLKKLSGNGKFKGRNPHETNLQNISMHGAGLHFFGQFLLNLEADEAIDRRLIVMKYEACFAHSAAARAEKVGKGHREDYIFDANTAIDSDEQRRELAPVFMALLIDRWERYHLGHAHEQEEGGSESESESESSKKKKKKKKKKQVSDSESEESELDDSDDSDEDSDDEASATSSDEDEKPKKLPWSEATPCGKWPPMPPLVQEWTNGAKGGGDENPYRDWAAGSVVLCGSPGAECAGWKNGKCECRHFLQFKDIKLAVSNDRVDKGEGNNGTAGAIKMFEAATGRSVISKLSPGLLSTELKEANFKGRHNNVFPAMQWRSAIESASGADLLAGLPPPKNPPERNPGYVHRVPSTSNHCSASGPVDAGASSVAPRYE